MCHSPLYGKYIGLALVENGVTRIGTRAFATDPARSGTHVPIEIVSHVSTTRRESGCMAEPKSFIADPVLAKFADSPLAGHSSRRIRRA
jgi:hypothetical protein